MGVTLAMKLNDWPGFTIVSLMRFAGTLMFAPSPLRLLGVNLVFHLPSKTMLPGTLGSGVGSGLGVAEGVGATVGEGVGTGVAGTGVGVGSTGVAGTGV